MDINLIIALGSITGCWLAILLLRVPAFVAYLSLMVGQILASNLQLNIAGFAYSETILVLAPLVLTILILRGRNPASKIARDALPALAVSIVMIIILYPMIPALDTALQEVSSGRVAEYKTWLLVGSSILVFASSLLSYPKPDHHNKHH